MRIALVLEYDGTPFKGWQEQPGLLTVQHAVEEAVGHVANHPIQVVCAGRTDAGVHARYQVVHCDTDRFRAPHAWVHGTNHFLPKTIAVQKACIMPETFHARFDAVSRTYHYLIENRATRSALKNHRVVFFPRHLEVEHMHEAAQQWLGEHDFSAFRDKQCQAKHPIRTVHQITVQRDQTLITLSITANAFLHHMVRNMVGTLLPIGLLQKPPDFAREVLTAKKRACAGVTAPSHGLYLHDVHYAPCYDDLLRA